MWTFTLFTLNIEKNMNSLTWYFCCTVQYTAHPKICTHGVQSSCTAEGTYSETIYPFNKIKKNVNLQGVPRNITVERKLNIVFGFICDIQLSTYFIMHDSWNNNHIILLLLSFPACGLPFLCRHFVQISILINHTKIIEIFTKFYMRPVTPISQERWTTFWK